MQATDSSNAEEPKDSGENLSHDALMARLMQGRQEEIESEEPVEEPEEEPVEELESEPEESEEPEEAEEEEESEVIDLLSLSPEEIQELAKKGKSRLLSRIGELTARAKSAEDQLQELKASKPVREVPQDENPFSSLKSFDDIKAKYSELERTLDTTDQLLEEYEDYSNDDVIEVGSQEFTKKQLKQANRNAREALTKYLPAQAEHLKKLEQVRETRNSYLNLARQEVPEIQDEESEIGREYKLLLEHPNHKRLKDVLAKHAPDLDVDIEYLLAHAVRSKIGNPKPKVSKGAGQKLKVNPPASPVGAGAAKSGNGANKKLDALRKRFQETGSPDDLIALRTAQMQPNS